MIKTEKKTVIILVGVIIIFILLSTTFFIDYFKPKTFKGLFKCQSCDYAFTKEVSDKAEVPLICEKCKKKSAYLAAEFLCPRCNISQTLILEVPPWEAKEKGEPLSALYGESLAYTLKSEKMKCLKCGAEMIIKDEGLRKRFQGESKEIEKRLKEEEEKEERKIR